jgi:hypothetical protein
MEKSLEVAGSERTHRERLHLLVSIAVLAPSSHNTQPWRFRLRADCVELMADRRRALPVNDPEDRELVMSCGAALFNMRVAAAHFGLEIVVDRLQEPEAPDLLARIRIGAGVGARGATAPELFGAIFRRRTHRKAFLEQPVPRQLVRELAGAAGEEGARLEVVDDGRTRRRLAGLVAFADELQWADPRWRDELSRWMRPRSAGHGLTVPAAMAPLTRMMIRRMSFGRRSAERSRDLTGKAPLLAVLSTEGDEPADWLVAGEALERVLLLAASRGVVAGYMNQPIEVQSLRPQVQALLGTERAPQLILRMGYAELREGAAVRRHLRDVIEERPGHAGTRPS